MRINFTLLYTGIFLFLAMLNVTGQSPFLEAQNKGIEVTRRMADYEEAMSLQNNLEYMNDIKNYTLQEWLRFFYSEIFSRHIRESSFMI